MIAARHINRELLLTFTVTLLVLFTVAIGGRFIGYLQDAVAGKYAADGLLTIIRLRLPGFLQLTLPFAFYIALLLTLGRLYAEQEMVVLQSSGLTPKRLLFWTLPSMLLMAATVAALSLVITPASNAELDRFLVEQRVRVGFDWLNPGLFNILDGGRRVTYAGSISEDASVLREVFISTYGGEEPIETIWAERGEQYVDQRTGSRFLVLEQGVRHVHAPSARQGEGNKSQRQQVTKFASLAQKIDSSPAARLVKERSLPTSVLMAGAGAAAVELHWRMALPIFGFISALIAFGVAPVKPRQGRFGRIVPGVLILLGYYLVLLINQNALAAGHSPASLGLWPAHALFAAVGAGLLMRLERPSRQ